MNDDNELDPVARLRAADPAGDVVPRNGFADEVVARITGPEADRPAEPAPVADLSAARARRGPRGLSIALVAASLVVIGAAGYGLGATTGGITNRAGDAAAPAISLQTGGSSGPIMEGGREPFVGASGADSKMSDSIYPYGFGRNSFSAIGLGTNAGTAQGYAFDPNASSTADTVTALAEAFGIQSPAELRDGGWTAGPQDGTAPSLSVSLDGMLSFYYQDPGLNPWQCAADAEVCEPTGTAPSEDVAIEALRSLLVTLGRDPATFEFTSQVWEGSPTRTAEARPVVDGQRIDQAWSVEVAEGGIASANGAAADLVGMGEYPVVSEQEGFERLSDPRFGGAATILPIAARQQAPATEPWVPPTAPPATPSTGTALSWPVHEVSIVSARLGLASQWQPDGSVLVVPAYEFTDADGGAWSVIAVADSKLNFRSE
jgi:hypothetical protein